MQPTKLPLFRTLVLGVTLTLALSGCVIHVGGNHHSDDYTGSVSKVFGGIDIDDHRTVSDLSTVNGGIELGDHVNAGSISTVNGGVSIGEHGNVASIDVVNGDVESNDHLSVSHDITTVNGDIELSRHANIGGSLITVNGDMDASDITIGGNVETVNGDIRFTGHCQIDGDITFKRPNKGNTSDTPSLHLDEHVMLTGNIILERDVNLTIPDRLKSRILWQNSHQ
ncbi:hypothetical protein FJ444_16285 [Aestuariibacter sp. GS-14]|uniref:hypothetical protein n=1 Tax=Aestuariibacter sp. GS-14 TaxID=2590670 RepID=UPI00112A8ED1|nr:hypothetical protein [Aestuariibacter sp. GS-14]TPV55677.1 hypothetical protein FJ444_16285 [Aestuariibacter sp. GS-14]